MIRSATALPRQVPREPSWRLNENKKSPAGEPGFCGVFFKFLVFN